MENDTEIEKMKALPDDVLAAAYDLAYDDGENKGSYAIKAKRMRDIIGGLMSPSMTLRQWSKLIDFLRSKIENPDMNESTIKTRAQELGNMPAFPCTSDQFALGDRGMSYHQWLVGMAMQGICSNRDFSEHTPQRIAELAIQQADATLAALAEREVRNG